jgi:hypothetical protein
MNVDCALARSSAAPMRVWIASIGPSRHDACGDVRADRREQHDQRDLAHERALAAHVRPGDDEHAAGGVEPAVVGDEGRAGLGEARLDDRMAAALDLDQRLLDEARPAPVGASRHLGERGQRVERRERARDGGDRGEVRRERVEEDVVELLLARERALAGRERLVLERLQLGSDEALGVLHRLPAPVVGGDARRLRLADLDEVAGDAVVLDAQRRDAGARALPRFELEQERVAAAADRAQLVELGVVALGDDAAVADERRRLLGDRAEQRDDLFGRRQRRREHLEERRAFFGERGTQPRQRGERRAQPGELARPHLPERDPRADPLDVGDVAERVAQRRRAVREQRRDRVVAIDRGAALAQRLRQPEPKRAAAHAGDAEVDRRQQRRCVAAAERSRQLEIAVRDRRQIDQLARALHRDAVDVGERAALRVLGVGEQRAGGGVRAGEAPRRRTPRATRCRAVRKACARRARRRTATAVVASASSAGRRRCRRAARDRR